MPPHDHSHAHNTHPHITLRGLPLPAKLVLTVFLCSVGLGYFSAMVQLHQKHSKKEGEPLPTPDDVVEVFAGLQKFDPNAPKPCSCLERLLTADRKAPDVSKDNMAPAFFTKSKGWEALRAARAADVNTLEAERNGELEAMLAWVRAEGAKQREAYDNDNFPLPADAKAKTITKQFLAADGGVKMKSLIDTRCMVCHKEQAPSLATFGELEPLITAPSQDIINGKWIRSSRQATIEKLTQSTHAHLLTFSVLFALTGLTFAFTTYSSFIRCILGPIVLIAQVADISCWWLARLPNVGPYFALAIMGTGAVVGLGLFAHILLSLLNMYGKNGTVLVVLLFLGGGAGVGFVGLKVIQPALDEEKKEVLQKKEKEKEKPAEGVVKKPDVVVAKADVSHLEKLVMGPRETSPDFPFTGKGTMGPAFFSKDGEFKRLLKDNPAAEFKTKLEAEREGERLALQAWIQLAEAERAKVYEADQFPLPKELAGKSITKDFVAGGAVKVKTLFETRCVSCHAKGGEQEDYPLETYAEISKYLVPKK